MPRKSTAAAMPAKPPTRQRSIVCIVCFRHIGSINVHGTKVFGFLREERHPRAMDH
jgi:hypothetical protein